MFKTSLTCSIVLGSHNTPSRPSKRADSFLAALPNNIHMIHCDQSSRQELPSTACVSFRAMPTSRTVTNRLSRLESLPAGLLHSVLLFSSNIDLLLCSHIIGAELSNKAVFREICIYYLFGPTWRNQTQKPMTTPTTILSCTPCNFEA